MEKYGCNRLEEIVSRIQEIESMNAKTASLNEELYDLYLIKKEIEANQ